MDDRETTGTRSQSRPEAGQEPERRGRLTVIEGVRPAKAPKPAEATIELPPENTTRWVTRRKAAVVAAVRAGQISIEEACARWSLSREDYESGSA